MMKYGSVCSGVEAATAAWHPLGWKPQWFSEIEKFPSAVLEHHHPNTPNLGDMTNFKEWPNDPIDLLVGGTPCQSFSVAGLRKGLDDPRGNLMLTYLAIAERYQPRWLVWENVSGVLSSNRGRDFGTFLAALGQIGFGFAYRMLDAQYFGVAQRRRRVFVVGHLGDWRRAAAVLFERESLSGYPAPSREAREEVARGPAKSFGRGKQNIGALPIAYDTTNITSPANGSNPKPSDPVFTLAKGQHPPLLTPAICAPLNTQLGLRGADTSNISRDSVSTEVTPTLGKSKTPAAAFAIHPHSIGRKPSAGPQGRDHLDAEQAYTHDARGVAQAVAKGHQVRRLTPIECERLQGFPDNYTQIAWRNKAAEDCPDGPRYKAMGNSMAVPVMRWIGERIQMVEDME
jgi:DNA (cytosine-5)-methyltransferase 1